MSYETLDGGNSISAFMRMAESKCAAILQEAHEIEQAKRHAKADTASARRQGLLGRQKYTAPDRKRADIEPSTERKKRCRNLTLAEKRAKVRQFDEFVEEGYTYMDACKLVGSSPSSLWLWRRQIQEVEA